ncbi:MAG: sensor histidine kinase [Lachnospiraceae bacterium]|nr:sensor histidine kinase [Lachnospiraceae bacterium]
MKLKTNILKKIRERRISLSFVMTGLVVCIVLVACVIGVIVFTYCYVNSMEENAVTSSEQAVSQVRNMVSHYTEDMQGIMEMVRINMGEAQEERSEFFQNLIDIRKDVEAITVHSEEGKLIAYWSNGQELKEQIHTNLSYKKLEDEGLFISVPHVQNLFKNYYPWVVTFSQRIKTEDGENIQVSMDIRFSNIASYVDKVGIGAHGYCFIADTDGNIVYHPQQQLIYAGLKEEQSEKIRTYRDGSHTFNGVIYTIHTLENCDWRIVGVSYVDELVTVRVSGMIRVVMFVVITVVVTTVLAGVLLAKSFSKPAKELAAAMRRFVREAESFEFYPVKGTEEIVALSDSFGHMVLQIQELMEKVRNEEITLRKTELNALQAQINPHFLYNTLDSIAWMCEVGRTKEAIEMVNALARLFRISISKGHELITVKQELQHAECYLKIQKFRYKSQFNYTFQVEESCLGYLCNKITLQPLIENAIVHGLDLSEEGEILIEVFEEEQDIIMTVYDNGVGMSTEQCEEILQKDVHQKGGIGIKNVNDRIKIYFGEQYGVTISSELDEWTKVEIRMPKISEESYEM